MCLKNKLLEMQLLTSPRDALLCHTDRCILRYWCYKKIFSYHRWMASLERYSGWFSLMIDKPMPEEFLNFISIALAEKIYITQACLTVAKTFDIIT